MPVAKRRFGPYLHILPAFVELVVMNGALDVATICVHPAKQGSFITLFLGGRTHSQAVPDITLPAKHTLFHHILLQLSDNGSFRGKCWNISSRLLAKGSFGLKCQKYKSFRKHSLFYHLTQSCLSMVSTVPFSFLWRLNNRWSIALLSPANKMQRCSYQGLKNPTKPYVSKTFASLLFWHCRWISPVSLGIKFILDDSAEQSLCWMPTFSGELAHSGWIRKCNIDKTLLCLLMPGASPTSILTTHQFVATSTFFRGNCLTCQGYLSQHFAVLCVRRYNWFDEPVH